MHNYFTRLLASIVVVCMTIDLANAQDSDLQSRTWKSKNGKHSIEAVLSDYDRLTKTVLLEDNNGEPIEVPIDQLSSADRRFVAREMRQRAKSTDLSDRSPASNPFAQKTNNDSEVEATVKQKPEIRRRRVGDSKNLYGIRWQAGVEDAMLVATGKETNRDDRPIMWFRVLGDLEGYM